MKFQNKLLIVTDLKIDETVYEGKNCIWYVFFFYLLKVFIILENEERVWVVYKFIKSKSWLVIMLLVMQHTSLIHNVIGYRIGSLGPSDIKFCACIEDRKTKAFSLLSYLGLLDFKFLTISYKLRGGGTTIKLAEFSPITKKS